MQCAWKVVLSIELKLSRVIRQQLADSAVHGKGERTHPKS